LIKTNSKPSRLGFAWSQTEAIRSLPVPTDVLAKIATVLPDRPSDQLWASPLLVPHRLQEAKVFGEHLPAIRQAIRDSQKISLTYRDGQGHLSCRTIWPLGLYLYSHVTIVCAWCELRSDFRAFRADRIDAYEALDARFNGQRCQLFQAFLAARKQSDLTSIETKQ
jgi:predicted DNA-binding transcriptional regulator YafY